VIAVSTIERRKRILVVNEGQTYVSNKITKSHQKEKDWKV
jgi:hypothetical protein